MKESERPFVFSSTDGIAGSKPGDFTIQHIPNLILDKNKDHNIALDKCNGHYSWYSINSTYNNNKISYSHDNGKINTLIIFPDGVYDHNDINNHIDSSIRANGHTIDSKTPGIKLTFSTSRFRVYVLLSTRYSVDLRGVDRNFNDIIGFTKINATTSQFGQALPNITNSVDNIKIKTSLINDSLDGGVSTDILYSFDTSDVSRAYPFKVEPRRRFYNKSNTNITSCVRIYMTDSINRPIDFNEVPDSLTVVIKSVDKEWIRQKNIIE